MEQEWAAYIFNYPLVLTCMFPELHETKFSSQSFHLQNSGILPTRMNQRGDPMKMNFKIFKYKNKYNEQLTLKEQMKKWGHLSSFLFSFLNYGPQIAQNSPFFANLC